MGKGAVWVVFVAENGDKFFSRDNFVVQQSLGEIGHYMGQVHHRWNRKVRRHPRGDALLLEF